MGVPMSRESGVPVSRGWNRLFTGFSTTSSEPKHGGGDSQYHAPFSTRRKAAVTVTFAHSRMQRLTQKGSLCHARSFNRLP